MMIMKPKQQTEPPASAGALTEQTAAAASQETETQMSQLQPPAADVEQLRTENAQLKAAIRLRDAQASVTTELGKSGARSPELLWDALRHELLFDDEGKPVNSAELIASLRAKFPEQFGTRVPASIDGGAGHTDTPLLTRAALAKMKPEDIAKLDWNEVKRVLSN